MRSQRGSWLGSSLLAAAFVAMPAACTMVRAQSGFGADPFNPYNNQYDPYVFPMGPAEPAAGGREAFMPQSGVRGANQFQQYLQGLQGGPGRNASDRSSIGMPYYRSAVDPLYRGRHYRPNAKSAEAFERAQQRVTDRYFAFYSTRDPARRAEILREYREARHDAELVTTGRGRASSRPLASPLFVEPGARRDSGAEGSAPSRPGVLDRTTPRGDRFETAPAVPGLGSGRSSGSASRRTTPTDVLNRSRAMDRDRGTGRRTGVSPSVPAPRARRPGLDAGTSASPRSPSPRPTTRRPRLPAPETPAPAEDNP
jgi:hypothetical protein